MKTYRRILQNLSEQTGCCQTTDGFPSSELRRKILAEAQHETLPSKPQTEPSRFLPLNDTEQIRTEYFEKIQKIGGCIAASHINGLLNSDTPLYLRELIIAGAEGIGRAIGGSYAVQLYPELRRLQIIGIEYQPVKERSATAIEASNYSFTVMNYGYCRDFSPVVTTRDSPGHEIFYDGINERHIEKFVFCSVEEADNALGAWERYNRSPRGKPPFAYGFTMEWDSPDSIPEISSIAHVDSYERAYDRKLEDGTRQVLMVFSSLQEALEVRRKKWKIIQKNRSKKVEKTKIQFQGKKRNHQAQTFEAPVASLEPPHQPIREKRKHISISK